MRADVDLRPFKAERFVFAVQAGDNPCKVLQVIFQRSDGTLLINFPYFDDDKGLVSIVTFPSHSASSMKLSLQPGGKVTSKRVKYAHHTDGEVHFSQTGKVRTFIKKESLPLADVEGHVFSLCFQGITHFERTDPLKDVGLPTSRRTVLNFAFDGAIPEAFKIVGRWYRAESLAARAQGSVFGPQALGQTPDGRRIPLFLISPPIGSPTAENILLVSCEGIPQLDKDREGVLLFIGGFDAPTTTNDLSQAATFLAALYPASNYGELLERIGSIDIAQHL